jgi:hypothetical protein
MANNKNEFTIAIFCDLRKAFDTVNHEILLKKLFNIGVRGIELEWFKDYLSNRKQFVSINNVNSNLLSIILGVPQGSILGPLLFLIYINDLPSITNLKSSLFADDTMLLDSHIDLHTLVLNVNSEFQKVISYFNQNKLSLHPEKTKFVLFTNKKNVGTPPIVFNYNDINNPISNADLIYPMECINSLPSSSIRFLGVMIDPLLNFKEHINKLNSKLATGLYYLRTSKNFLNQTALKYIYYVLCYSYLDMY